MRLARTQLSECQSHCVTIVSVRGKCLGIYLRFHVVHEFAVVVIIPLIILHAWISLVLVISDEALNAAIQIHLYFIGIYP